MSDGYKLQLNLKFDGSSPLLNIVGDSPEEFQRNVEFATSSADAIIDAAILFQTGYLLKKPQDSPPAQQAQKSWSRSGSQQSNQRKPEDDQPQGPPPSCRHGEMRWVKGGISQRTKKPYAGFWACTADRADQCDPVNV